MLTIFGFLVAFHTATVNWKEEAFAHIKFEVADEIEAFFNEASGLIIKAKLFIQSLIDTANKINEHGITDDTIFEVQMISANTSDFISARNQLSGMAISVHRLLGKNSAALSSEWGALENLERSIKAFSDITHLMWIHIPIIVDSETDSTAQFVAQLNVTQCTGFISCCDRNYGFINGITGALRGQLILPLVKFNFSSFMILIKNRSLMAEFLSQIRGK